MAKHNERRFPAKHQPNLATLTDFIEQLRAGRPVRVASHHPYNEITSLISTIAAAKAHFNYVPGFESLVADLSALEFIRAKTHFIVRLNKETTAEETTSAETNFNPETFSFS